MTRNKLSDHHRRVEWRCAVPVSILISREWVHSRIIVKPHFEHIRPLTVFLSLKWGYSYNGVYHTVQNMTDPTRVICVIAAFAATVAIIIE